MTNYWPYGFEQKMTDNWGMVAQLISALTRVFVPLREPPGAPAACRLFSVRQRFASKMLALPVKRFMVAMLAPFGVGGFPSTAADSARYANRTPQRGVTTQESGLPKVQSRFADFPLA